MPRPQSLLWSSSILATQEGTLASAGSGPACAGWPLWPPPQEPSASIVSEPDASKTLDQERMCDKPPGNRPIPRIRDLGHTSQRGRVFTSGGPMRRLTLPLTLVLIGCGHSEKA